MQDKIIIKGARQHNLKNIDLEIPKNKLIVFTGVSGSGKSSLAFDTIYAEGQRRYVESLSSYARQFLGVMDKPDVDSIAGLSPAISIDQKASSHNPRSTVGTITEIYDYLRLLFARIGNPHCLNCNREISRQSIPQITQKVITLLQNEINNNNKKLLRLLILSPVVRDRKGEYKDLFTNLKIKGYAKVRIDQKVVDLGTDLTLIKTNKHTIEAMIDRITVEKKTFKSDNIKVFSSRLNESIEQAVLLSDGLVVVSLVNDPSFTFPQYPKKFTDHLYSQKFACPVCNLTIAEIEPRIFSFNSPHGACPKCSGIGTLQKVDPNLIINPNLSISEGGILPFAKVILSDTWYGRILIKVSETIGINIHEPLKTVSKENMEKLLFGTQDDIYEIQGENRHGKMVTIYETFGGIIPELEKRFSQTQSDFVRNEIGKYLKEEICPLCRGKRLKKEALSVTIDGKSIADVTNLSIKNTAFFIKGLKNILPKRDYDIGELILREIITRLTFLISVGLDYLTLDRGAQTLAGGEAQRIRLASQIGSGLSGVLYILDEPSIGLHQKDNQRLIDTLFKLRDLGNTVIVVEHDKEMMINADLIYDFGPLAGKHGGRLIASGTPDKIKADPNSLTGQYLSLRKEIRFLKKKIDSSGQYLEIFGCMENNLKNIDLKIPLNQFVCVTGVSGSGKSTLVVNTLYQSIAKYFNYYHKGNIGKYREIKGMDQINKVILIDQSPIGRTPRSNPATYTGAFTYIRDLFAMLPESKIRGFSPGRFSFNVKGGRCEVCQGEGEIKIEMQFMPDVYIKCDSCKGTRFNSETLDIHYKDKNIAQILQMTVEEALRFFLNIPGLVNKLKTLHEVGLSYIQLGQPAPQLSGGEAQRIKLATELSKRFAKSTLYILDEPTTGLHFADLEKLLIVLKELVNLGHTVVVIEHNLDVIKNADWIIDLGPEGGEAGGQIIAEGKPEDIQNIPRSYTGVFLKKTLHQII